MKNYSLKAKVFMLLLVITGMVVLVMSLLMQQGVDKSFKNYKKSLSKEFNHRVINTLEWYYDNEGGWDKLVGNERQWFHLLNKSAIKVSRKASEVKSKKTHKGMKIPDIELRDEIKEKLNQFIPNYALFDTKKKKIVGASEWEKDQGSVFKIWHQKKVVGFLISTGEQASVSKQDRNFASRIKKLILLMAVILLVISVLLTVPVANYLVKPIKAINNATKKAASGDYSVRTNIKRKDELGQLATNFNRLAETLESNAATQKKQMADIAHELRTPIAVVMAELEAIQDGIHHADKESVGTMHGQISALKNLVDDLHQLSLSDLGTLRYKMEKMDLVPLVKQVVAAFSLAAEQKDLSLKLKESSLSCYVLGDHNRLHQLLNNLVNNAISYTDAGGVIEVSIECKDKVITLLIADSEPTLTTAEMAKMFDRLYRKEASRNKKTGGSGLGLTIVKNIVSAHQGHIIAMPSELGGVAMKITLPKVV
ncbi:ATP-binding protein [Marinicella rhabdoformis]|uniref:ATP-binding protein n=1 Tax=Marinicella rhabdoformis TaxID=2580566 RepID=UPI0012AED5A4|nr:ATP-binding protein [Marinicella rhabdoformis]